MTSTDATPDLHATDLGAPIAAGRTAEVFGRGGDEVVKVLRPGFDDRIGEQEAIVAALVDRAGIGAPHFRGTVRVDGRLGLRYERLDGPSMLDSLSRRVWAIDGLGRRFAELHAGMHGTSGGDLPDQKAGMLRMIERGADHAPADGARRAIERLEELRSGDSICHGDMHPGNVILAARGPVVIDWLTASRGNPAGDVARSLFLIGLSGLPPHIPRFERRLIALVRRRFVGVYLRRYRQLRPLEGAELRAWRLPILAARLGEGIATERGAIGALIERELSSVPER